MTCRARPKIMSSCSTSAPRPPGAAAPDRDRCRRALRSTTSACPAVSSARSASSPVIRSTLALAWSLRSFRCAEIDRARRPAARRRSRTLVRLAAPAAWIRATNVTISVIARTSNPESVG